MSIEIVKDHNPSCWCDKCQSYHPDTTPHDDEVDVDSTGPETAADQSWQRKRGGSKNLFKTTIFTAKGKVIISTDIDILGFLATTNTVGIIDILSNKVKKSFFAEVESTIYADFDIKIFGGKYPAILRITRMGKKECKDIHAQHSMALEAVMNILIDGGVMGGDEPSKGLPGQSNASIKS